MTRSNVVAVISFAVVFAAGFFVGHLGWGGNGGGRPSELDLSQPQREAVRKIWNEQLTRTTKEAAERWDAAERARDEAVRKLLKPEQLPAYNAIEADHQARAKQFGADLIQTQLDAENRTRQLLSPQQRERFDKLVAERGSGSARVTVAPPGVPVSDLRAVPPTTQPKDAQGR